MFEIFGKKSGNIKRIFLNKYVIVLLIFVVVIVFFDDHNLISRFQTLRKTDRVKKQIEYYEKDIKDNRQKINELKAGGKSVEKFAREQYLFKKDNEDIFIIKEK